MNKIYTHKRGKRGAGGGGGRVGIDWGGDTSGYYTKPRQTIQSPKALYKAQTIYRKPRKEYTKAQKDYTKPREIIQIPQKDNAMTHMI